MFTPQVLLAILAPSFGSRPDRRFGPRGVLMLGLSADLLFLALLAVGALLAGTDAAFVLLPKPKPKAPVAMTLNTLIGGFFSPAPTPPSWSWTRCWRWHCAGVGPGRAVHGLGIW